MSRSYMIVESANTACFIVDLALEAGFNNPSAWTAKTFDVVPDSVVSTLTLGAIGASDSSGLSIDRVTLISAMPEPATYAMRLTDLRLMSFVGRCHAA